MVKPIGPSRQSTPVKTEVEQTEVQTGKEQAASTNKAVPIYSEKAQISRRAEHSMSGEAWALKLNQQLDTAKQTPKPAGSMVLPRVGWEVNVSPSENSSVPTPYPNIANANQKDESKK